MLLPYVYETGVIGLLVVCGIGYYLMRLWASLRYVLAFAAFAGVWLVGITITTSYNQLLPIWLALGWLTVWPDVCETAATRQNLAAGLPRVYRTRSTADRPALPGRTASTVAPLFGVHLNRGGGTPC